MRVRTPQQKKALSYAKDCRNNYGESDKGSRKAIPQRKAGVNRGYRRRINQILSGKELNNPDQIDFIDSKVKNVRRMYWKKAADEPLGAFVKRKLERRRTHAGNGKTARKRAAAFLTALRIKATQTEDG